MPFGVGQFYNLTQNTTSELVNPSVRTLSFSPDGTLVTFWTRTAGAANEINIRAAPVPILNTYFTQPAALALI